jgi:hypothetical protein
MKTLITILILSAAVTFGQSIPDSTKKQNKEQKQEKVQNQNSEMKQVQKQTGPKENPQKAVKKSRKGKDVFIDKDGDGICDSRQSGMSFNKMRKRFGKGKKGPSGQGGKGNMNGSGGN